jgi:hypothetical protein
MPFGFWMIQNNFPISTKFTVTPTGPYRFCMDKSTEQYHYGVFHFWYHGFGMYCTVDDDTGQELVQNMTSAWFSFYYSAPTIE